MQASRVKEPRETIPGGRHEAAAPAQRRLAPVRALRAGWHRLDQRVFTPFCGAAFRLAFGNDAGFLNNVLPPLELARLRRTCRASAGDPRQRQAAEFLRREGYLLLDPGYELALLRAICERFRAGIEDPDRSMAWGTAAKRDSSRLLAHCLRLIPELKLLLTPDIQGILRAYYGTHFKVETVRCWRNYHVEHVDARRDLDSNQWRNDSSPVTSLRLFVYLSEGITRDTGALRFHSRQSTRQILRSFGCFRRSHLSVRARRLLEDPTRVRYLEGGVGAACLCSVPTCMHSAGVPREGAVRDLAQFHLSPSGQPLAEDWDRRLPADRAVLLNEGNA